MKKGRLTIIGALESDTEECSLCAKAKEGLVVQEEDGTQLNWCWACEETDPDAATLKDERGAKRELSRVH